jgi:hypothetical protein
MRTETMMARQHKTCDNVATVSLRSHITRLMLLGAYVDSYKW